MPAEATAEEVTETIETGTSAEAAEALEAASTETAAAAVEAASAEKAADALEGVATEKAADIIEEVATEKAADDRKDFDGRHISNPPSPRTTRKPRGVSSLTRIIIAILLIRSQED